MDATVKLSVIIPTLKARVQIPAFLEDYEILTIGLPGRARSRNYGALKASSEILFFMDDDASFDESTFQRILSSLGPRMIVCKEHPVMGTRVMAIRKDLFLEVGGFDETMETGEDADFGFRARNLGVEIRFIPTRLIGHREHATPSGYVQLLQHTKNIIRYLLRYRQCWTGKRGVEPMSVSGCFWLFTESTGLGLPTLLKTVSAFFTFYYYLLFDQLKALESSPNLNLK